jgi:hypothetical protein
MSSSPTTPTSPYVSYVTGPRGVHLPPSPENLKKYHVDTSRSPYPNVRLFKSSSPTSVHLSQHESSLNVLAAFSPSSVPLSQHESNLVVSPVQLVADVQHVAEVFPVQPLADVQRVAGVYPVRPVADVQRVAGVFPVQPSADVQRVAGVFPVQPSADVQRVAGVFPVRPVADVQRVAGVSFPKYQELNDRERSIAAEARLQAVQDFNTDLIYQRESTRQSTELRKPDRSEESQPDFVSNLSISDPAGNVLHDLSACVHLETKLVNEKLSVATVQALFDHALHRHPQLLKILETVQKGQTVKFAILSFRNLFQSLFKPTERTMAMVSILAASRMSLSVEIKVKTAIKVAASTRFSDLESIALKAAAFGSIPVINCDFKTRVLTQLPGIVQLQGYINPTDIEAHWTAMTAFVINAVCFVKFEKHELVAAKLQLTSFSALHAVDMHLTIAAYEGLFDVCTNWFGKPVETDYDKIQRFISRCPAIVRTEYVILLTDSKCDEYSMDWESFLPVLGEAWDTAFRKQQLSTELGLGQGQSEQHSSGKVKVKAAEQDTGSWSDVMISCSMCDSDFVFTAKNQKEFSLKEPPWDAPKRCSTCRSAANGRSEKECNLFASNGVCPYGDKCKFEHSDSPASPVQTFQGRRLSQLLPGSSNKPCAKLTSTGECSDGDACLYKHPGREAQQRAKGFAIQSENAAKAEHETHSKATLQKRWDT